MAMHTKNVLADPHATLLIVQAAGDGNPLGAGRISLMGEVLPVENQQERAEVEAGYVERNPSARNYLQFDDFRFFKLHLVDIYFVGGFGVMGWITAEEFKSAKPDPLVDVAAGILQHMNQEHRKSMVKLAAHRCGLAAEDAEMLSVDRLGFNLRVRTHEGMKGVRLAYDAPAESAEAVRHALIDMVRASTA
jgi:putative heme iron utilization protein